MEEQVRKIAGKYLQNVREATDGNLRARCPFHDSRSASRSFVISMDSGMWMCFGCGARGAFITLLRMLHVPGTTIDRIAKDIDRRETPVNFKRREIARQVVETTVLPEYVLAAYDSCPVKLLDAGFDMDLLQRNDVGYDRKHDRITFAIRDYLGRLVAISGRSYEDGTEPRYKVYTTGPTGELGQVVENYEPANRRHLYGFHEVYPERFFNPQSCSENPLIVVEGFKGRLWLVQMGYRHTIAVMGSSLTAHQKWLLSRVRGPFYVMLDHEPGKSFPDGEGRCAAYKIAEQLSLSDRALICTYDEEKKAGTSPDDLSRAEVENMIKAAKSRVQHQLRNRRTWDSPHSAALSRPRLP